jgi:hypothetical protein
MSTPKGKILYLSETYEGSVHDKKICDEEPFEFQQETELLQDLGYKGHAPKNAVIQMPVKSSKYKKLTEGEKNDNKMKSSRRVAIEHAISGVKRCRVVKDKFRYRRYGYDDLVMELACGLHNLRVDYRKIA